MKSNLQFIHWRITIPSQPSLSQDRGFQHEILSALIQARNSTKAKVYSFFCEHFQFHALVQIEKSKIERFEAQFKEESSKSAVAKIPTQIRYKARDRSAFSESKFPELRKWGLQILDQPCAGLEIHENSKTHIHRFRVMQYQKFSWPIRRSIVIHLPINKGFFKNPMQLATR